MASVFLSYDRDDISKARQIAQALEKGGHAVWWDRQITGGSQYGAEIEEALKRSDAVVVLWSERAIQSAWVRDEAAAGRDAGKLVPVRLDAADPPMGFRQYQTIDLSRWRGRRGAESFRELDRAISSLRLEQGTDAPEAAAKAFKARRWGLRHGLVIAVAVAALIAAGWFVIRGAGSKYAPVVAVTAADTSASSEQLARDLYVKLGRLQAIDTKPIELVDQGSDRRPDFTFQVAGSQFGSQSHASITLTDEDRTLLWSKDFELPASQIGDLKQQIGLSAARVLDCAAQAVSSGKFDQPTLKMYLNGCATLSQLAWNDFRSLVPVFRQVTRKAPRFEGGWAHLLLTEAYVIGWELLKKDSPEARTLRTDIQQARKLFPNIPEAYWAEYALVPENDLDGQAELISRATKTHPDHPVVLTTQAGFLVRVGRMDEAVEKAKRAAELSPLSPEEMGFYINVLGWAGRADLAQRELDKVEKLAPGVHSLIDTRWRHHLRYGDPKKALEITRSGVSAGYADQETYLLARIEPTQANIERAVADAKSRVGRQPRAMGMLVQTLAEFGREEEIFSILEEPRSWEVIDSIDAFFRPAFRRFRHDPRFMRVAQRAGLLDYWRKSGKWPDFCFDPDLPYDCKAEAAKLGA